MESDSDGIASVHDPGNESRAWSSTFGRVNERLRTPIYENRKKDVCLSTSREIPGQYMADKRRWVYKFLDYYKCFEGYNNYSDLIKAMKISGNKFNNQIVLVCHNEDQCEQIVLKLKDVPGPVGNVAGLTQLFCPRWQQETISVYISWVRSTIDVQKYLIDGFLSNYGTVKSHRPIVDDRGIETFEYVFVMPMKDVRDNPPPAFFWLGRQKLRVKYRGQVMTCYACDEEGHVAGQCPKKKSLSSSDNLHQSPSVFDSDNYDKHYPPASSGNQSQKAPIGNANDTTTSGLMNSVPVNSSKSQSLEKHDDGEKLDDDDNVSDKTITENTSDIHVNNLMIASTGTNSQVSKSPLDLSDPTKGSTVSFSALASGSLPSSSVSNLSLTGKRTHDDSVDDEPKKTKTDSEGKTIGHMFIKDVLNNMLENVENSNRLMDVDGAVGLLGIPEQQVLPSIPAKPPNTDTNGTVGLSGIPEQQEVPPIPTEPPDD